MNMKKGIAVALCGVSLFSCFAVTSCGDEVVLDGKTINVRMVNAGYGKGWFEKIAEKFEELYKEEGYKVNLLEPENSLQGQTALNEMRLDYDLQKIDVYFTAGCYVYQMLDKTFGECVEDLNGVYNYGAINFDGTVEETPIKDTAGKMYDYLLVDPDNPTEYYRFQYYSAPQGLVCNQKILKDYGFDYLPVTTNELFEMYDAIYYGANGRGGTKETGIYPQTWAQANAYSYPYYNLLDSFGGMLGHDAWDDFFTLDFLKETDINGAGAYYASLEEKMIPALEAFIHQYDTVYSYVGSTTQKHDMAHAQVAMGKAAFMADGSYFFNEVKANFANFLPNLRIVKQPTVSALGTILKLDGSGANADKCEEILAFLCRACDNGADATALKALAEEAYPEITFTEAQMQSVYEARTVNSMNLQADGYIAKGSPMKKEAELLLRMMASPDAAEVMAEYCMPHTYYPVTEVNAEYEFIADTNLLVANVRKPIFNNYKLGLRNATSAGMFGSMGLNICTRIMSEIGVVENPKDRNYWKLASDYVSSINKYMNDNWSELLKKAGY